jgi:hypothetical protein
VEEQIKPDEDVEAHKAKAKRLRGDEATEATETESDDFELHKKSAQRADEGGESGDDDVELHRRIKSK